jgi:hypothetical protein
MDVSRLLRLLTKASLVIGLAATTRLGAMTDITGTFDVNKAPQAFYDFTQQEYFQLFTFFDEARTVPWNDVHGNPHPPGWVSHYGVLNGGVYFTTDLLSKPPEPTALVSWNFSNLANYSMSRILVVGRATDNTVCYNLYSVSWGGRITHSDFVDLDGLANIQSISFYGRTPDSPVPDTGTTIGFLTIALVLLFAFYTVNLRYLRRGLRARPSTEC